LPANSFFIYLISCYEGICVDKSAYNIHKKLRRDGAEELDS
jgi:hypothetical protein